MIHKRFFGRLCGLLSALLLLLSPVTAAASETGAAQMHAGILRYHGISDGCGLSQMLVPGGAAEWYVFALRLDGRCDLSAYRAALLSYLDGKSGIAAATRQKYALALLASGGGHPFVDAVLTDSIGEMGLMSYIFGLHLLENGCVSPSADTASVTAELLARQCADGGWAITGNAGNPDVTAMAIQALAPGCDRSEEVAAAVERGLLFLSAAQTPAGGFVAYGEENAESTAQVILALAALGIDAETDARFIKDRTLLSFLASLQDPSGGFAHAAGGSVSNAATAQVKLALSAHIRFTETGEPVRPYLFGLSAEELSAGELSAGEIPPAPTVTEALGYKPWAAAGIALLGFAVCGVIYLRKRRWQVLLVPLLVTAAAVVLVLTLDIRLPEDYYGTADTGEVIGTVTVTIRCDAVAGTAAHIPADGVMLGTAEIPLYAGDTVYDVTVRAARMHRIPLENDGTAAMAYIVGIGNLYALDFGDMSGWEYSVNGVSPDVGCGGYVPGHGDDVLWEYVTPQG